MSMEEAIKNFHKQFTFEPEVIYGEKLPSMKRFVVGGMGGSGHAADLLKAGNPQLDLHGYRNYGLPFFSGESSGEYLFIASSYSGNTEETVDFAQEALRKGYNLATISKGGKLHQFSQEHKIPHVVLPDIGIQPRSALGFSILGLTKLMGLNSVREELNKLESVLNPNSYENKGKELASLLSEHVPVVYASSRNRAVINNWKIKFNETGKIPAYGGVFPELNHNEIEGYSNANKGKTPTEQFHFLFLTDDTDHPRVQKRMQITEKLYKEQGLPVTELPLVGSGRFERMFGSLLLADWTALFTAQNYGLDSEPVPMVEKLKKMLE